MVNHQISFSGVTLAGGEPGKPVLLQINDDQFPKSFLQGLRTIPPPANGSTLPAVTTPQAASTSQVATSPSVAATLFQPVQRVTHLALAQLNCESVGYPRLDSKKVISAGLVIRRVPLNNGYTNLAGQPSPWVRNSTGQFSWILGDSNHADDDPDPTLRPQAHTGQPALDQMLAAQSLASANTETYTPAFVAAPDICAAVGRTLVYAVIPTASSEAASLAPQPPQYKASDVTNALPTLLKAGSHSAPGMDLTVDYRFLSDDYASAHAPANFTTFTTTLRMMYSVFGAFEGTPGAQALLNILHGYNVTIAAPGGGYQQTAMDQFYQNAAAALIDYDPNSDPSHNPPQLLMPHAWDAISNADQGRIVTAVGNLLVQRSSLTATPEGRFQDAARLYRLRLFCRVQSENPGCPPQLVWSDFSDPFRIAAWHENGGRVVAPVPLPDPTSPGVLQSMKNKPNASFAVPAGLMNAMQGATLSGLSAGSAGAGGGITLNWICGFSIPLITICAFFVLNIFLTLLNIVFFWLPFIKICIPFPAPAPPGTTSGSQP
jgi:hypothetical protein